jgi:hypothetical protein
MSGMPVSPPVKVAEAPQVAAVPLNGAGRGVPVEL